MDNMCVGMDVVMEKRYDHHSSPDIRVLFSSRLHTLPLNRHRTSTPHHTLTNMVRPSRCHVATIVICGAFLPLSTPFCWIEPRWYWELERLLAVSPGVACSEYFGTLYEALFPPEEL